MNITKLVLPFPPSINGYWRAISQGRGRNSRVILSERGREYRGRARDVVAIASGWRKYDGPVAVLIVLHRGDRRAYDIDNYAKAALDALTHAGLWDDDGQVCELTIRRGEVRPGNGCAIVLIRDMPEVEATA